MIQSGTEMMKFVKGVRQFSQDLANLLGTVDNLLGGDGWKNAAARDIALAGASAAIYQPELWFPYDVFRFYKHSGKPHVLCSVSVLLDPVDVELTEPLLTTCLFDYGKPNALGEWSYWYSRFHGYMPSRRDDGSWHEQSSDAWPNDKRKYQFRRVLTRGLPLAVVTDSASLAKSLIQPLLQRLGDL
ncbi:MAG TPA: hypothetical protein VJ801_01160 [Polyangia bacterium]|jgi:hypothetical protein|nr:hypothetical protein [Polyangia bacterium]